MLRYFYLLICIQLSFCTEYIDSNLDSNVRSKSRLFRKHTKSTKKSRVVQFDVENFIRRPDEDAIDYGSYAYSNRVRENRRVPANYGDYGSFIESSENDKEINKAPDYSNIDDNGLDKKVSLSKEVNSRHFNFHSLAFDDKSNVKSHSHSQVVPNLPEKLVVDRNEISDPEKRCSFKNMKVPFFSYSKSTTKGKQQKKRKLFCFNCHKTSTTTSANSFDDTSDIKNDDIHKNHLGNDKRENKEKKISKRAYDQLCPKCIRELLNSLKRKTTKKVKHATKSYDKETKFTTKAKSTILDKPDTLEDNLEGENNPSVVRQKRADELSENDRRLKELEEVERKIDNIQITVPTFNTISLNV